MWSGVGGSTILYSAHWVRFLPSDFRVRSLDGIADDWPFTYDDLVPFYERVEQEFAVSGAAGDPAYPAGAGPPLPPLPIGRIGRRAAAGMDELGWHWWPGPQSIASRAHGNLRACGLRGTCLTGCPDRAKATTDLTHWPEALERGVRLVTGARVSEITTDARGRASGATYIDRAGQEHHQAADVVIVCANGVGTPRLLQLSGLANSSGLVGKRLMMHPYAAVVGFYDEPLESWLGPTGQSIQSMQFYETDESRGFVRGGKWQVMSTGGPLGLRAAYGGSAAGGALRREPPPQPARAARPRARVGGHRRGSAGGLELRHARSGADGLATASRRPRSSTATRTTRASCSTSISSACTRPTPPPGAQDGRHAADARLRLARPGHVQDGRRPRNVGRRRGRPGARRRRISTSTTAASSRPRPASIRRPRSRRSACAARSA